MKLGPDERLSALLLFVFFWCLFSCLSPAYGTTVRYALVIGNNRGIDAEGKQPFPALAHAETEALRLRDQLVRYAHFDNSSRRTMLLLGATRAQIRAAVATIAEQKAQDQKELGLASSLFLFYFTGHGSQKNLLLEDGPMSTNELAEIFQTIKADFTIGAFDACFSGSLDPDSLREKGLGNDPGLDLFRELPEEVLTAKGSIWFLSSGPSQLSYEDEKLGSVFTHFFTEALEHADLDGPGITLDRLWNYVQRNTVAYTTKRNRPQVPRQFVARLQSTGPMYFSFPLKRSATLELAESVRGRFLLNYAEGTLSEVIHKRKGIRRQMAVYPGQARLLTMKGGQVMDSKEVELRPNTRLVLHSIKDAQISTRLGHSARSLWQQTTDTQTLQATAIGPGASWQLGTSYGLRLGSRDSADVRHTALIELRLDHGSFIASAGLGYGQQSRTFENWSFTTHAALMHLRAGYGIELGPTRLATTVGWSLARLFQSYDNDESRSGWSTGPELRLGLLFPVDARIAFEAFVSGGSQWTLGAGNSSGYRWIPHYGGGLATYLRF